MKAIRHGIDPEGKPIFMPAVGSTSFLSDEDLGAIIAYIKSVPPVDNELPRTRIGPMARYMILRMPFLLAAQVIRPRCPATPRA